MTKTHVRTGVRSSVTGKPRGPIRDRFGLLGTIPVLLLLTLWQLFGNTDPLRFPPPATWIPAVAELGAQGLLLPAALTSAATFVVGLLIATVLGVVGGVLIGSSRPVERTLNPSIDFFRGLPLPAIVPAAILVLGIGFSSNVAIVAFGLVWPILLNTILARRNISATRLDVARVLRLGKGAEFWKVILPSILPGAMVGLRISASLGVISVLVVEMLTRASGLGFLLLDRQLRFDAAGTWGLLLVIGIAGFLLNFGLGALERRFSRFAPS